MIQAASSGGSSFGAALYDGGDFVNEAGGTVTNDAFGVVVRGAYGTIDNAGTIYGRVQAVYMGATNSLLIVHPGAVFEGSVAAGAHATTSTIELASGAITGTLTGVGSEYSGFGTIVIDSGATWNIGPISTAETIQNAGTIVGGASADGILLEAGGSVINQAGGAISGEYAVGVMGGGTVENAGTMSGTNASVVFYSDAANRLIVDAGARFNGKVLGDGSQNTIELTANSGAGTLSGLGSEYVGFQTVTIDSAATWDIAGKIAAFETTAIDGFNSHDQLDLTDLTFNGADTVTLNSSNQLIIADAGGNITIQTNGVNDIARFKLLSDGHGGTVIEGLPAISQINSYQGYGSVLTNKYYLSPLTVTQAGTIHNAAGNGIASTYSWSIQNAGSIYGTANGVALAGGEVDNTGTITGGGDAVYLLGSGTVHNSGLIHDVPGYQIYGVQLHGGGDFINDASGTVTNVNFGVVVRGGSGTVDNSGTIFGRTQAVYMGAANSLLIDHAGAVFEGNVVAGASATTATIELATGSATGTLSGLGSQFTGFGTITIDPAAAWYIAGKAAAFETTAIGGLNASDQLDLTDLTFNAGDTATLNGSDQLVIADPDGNITIQLKGVAASTFSLSRDSNGGTLIEKGAQSQIIGSYGSGINLVAGTFTNPITITDTATISSSSDALGAATDWTIDNSGAISGGVGIVLGAGGSVDNEAGGTITGTGFGVYVESSSVGTVDNSGVILGAGGAGSSFGVALYGGGDFINEAGGTVTNDGFGVVVRGTYGTVDNAGTIYGGTEAVYMGATNSLLIVHPGAVFEGGVVAGAHAAISTIELKAGGSGTLSGLGAQYQGFHTVTIDSGATWDITGTMAGIGGTTIGGFNAHDRLDITDLTFASGDTVTLNSAQRRADRSGRGRHNRSGYGSAGGQLRRRILPSGRRWRQRHLYHRGWDAVLLPRHADTDGGRREAGRGSEDRRQADHPLGRGPADPLDRHPRLYGPVRRGKSQYIAGLDQGRCAGEQRTPARPVGLAAPRHVPG